jgi:hypothetical protein
MERGQKARTLPKEYQTSVIKGKVISSNVDKEINSSALKNVKYGI